MRLIDADALDVMNVTVPEGLDPDSFIVGMGFVLRRIYLAPTIEAGPVVRCADCRHHGVSNETLMDGKYKRCAVNGAWHTGSWYCASGERKEDAVD